MDLHSSDGTVPLRELLDKLRLVRLDNCVIENGMVPNNSVLLDICTVDKFKNALNTLGNSPCNPGTWIMDIASI